jgi:hypothetical protein
MDFVKQFEKDDEKLTWKERMERESILGKSDDHKYPFKNTCKKSVGEYFATKQDKVNLVKYLANHPTMPIKDKELVQKTLK